MTREPVPLTVPPMILSPGCLAEGIDSPVTIDSSTDTLALENFAIDWHAVTGPDAKMIADLDQLKCHFLVVAASPSSGALFWAPI